MAHRFEIRKNKAGEFVAELGDESGGEEIAELGEAIAKAGMPPDSEEHARKELKRLERMPDSSAPIWRLRAKACTSPCATVTTKSSGPLTLNAARTTI